MAEAAAPSSPPNTGAAHAPAGGPDRLLADGEVPSLRTATSQTYRLPSGVYQARVYSQAVNYRDGSGAWQHIDNRLTAEPGGWRNKANAVSVHVPANLAGNAVSVADGRDTLGFVIDGAAPTAGAVDADSATYAGVLPHVSVTEQAINAGLKESLVLHSASAPTTFTFHPRLSPGLALSATRDGGLVANDPDGNAVLQVLPPVVTDAAGEAMPPGRYVLEDGNGANDTVTLSLDTGWLSEASRQFPVTVDPTTVATGYSSATYIYSGAATTNYSSQTSWKVGKDAGGVYRLLEKFDVAGAVPNHVDFLAVTLNSEELTASGAAIPVSAYQVSTGWTASTATWNTYDGTHAWTAAGGDTTGSAIDTETTPNNHLDGDGDDFYFGRLSELASGWLDGSTPNNGLLVREDPESTSSVLTIPGTANPYLSINYVYRTGLQSFFTYYQRSLTDHAQLNVNVANGNMVLANKDVHVTGVGVPLTINRYYNSQGDANPLHAGGLPVKWTQGYGRDMQVDEGAPEDGQLYYGPTGDIEWFPPAHTNVDPDSDGDIDNFQSPPGINADLSDEEGTQYYDMTFHHGAVKYQFGYFGLLDYVKDRNGNAISFTYGTPLSFSSQLTSVTDTQGRGYSVGYTSGLETSITDANISPSRSWSFSYTSGYLTGYTDPASQTTGYGYNAAGLLYQVTDPRSNTTQLTYDTSNRVTSIQDPGGNCAGTPATGCVTFAYHDNSTDSKCSAYGYSIVTDENGHTTEYCYDKHDRVTKTIDANNNTRSASYTSNFDVASLTDGQSNVFHLGYDALNNLTSLDRPHSSGGCNATDFSLSTNCTAQFGYPSTSGQTAPYPMSDYQPTSMVDGQKNCTSYSYDSAGNMTDAYTGRTIDSTNKTQCTNSGGTHLSNHYETSSGSTNCGPSGTPPTTKVGVLCSTSDGAGHTTSFSYDATGNLTTISPPGPLGNTTVSVDGDGRPTSVTDGASRSTKYFYDGDDRITELRFDGGSSSTCSSTDATAGNCIGYVYDGNGNLTSRLDNTGTTSWSYDAQNRPLSKTFPTSISTVASTVTYDAVGNVLTYTDVGTGSGQVSYAYDPANNLTSIAEPGGSCPGSPTFPNSTKCTGINYNSDNQRTKTTFPSGQVVLTCYDTASRQTLVAGYRPSASAGTCTSPGASPFIKRSYSYGTGDLRTSVTNEAGTTTNYGYDAQNRLHTAGSFTYNYDSAGNVTSMVNGATTTYYGYNNADEMCWDGTTNGSIPNPGSACTSNPGPSGDNSRMYDGAGNQCWTASTSGSAYSCASAPTGATTYSYNSKGQTTNIGGVTFSYADIGQKERVTTGGTTYVNGLLGLNARNASGTWVDFTRSPQGGLNTLRQGNGTSSTNDYYTMDALGSTIAVTSSSGTTDDATYTYDPYGKTTGSGALASTNPYQYVGGYATSSINLLLFGDRYYNQNAGRWTQRDPLAGGLTNPRQINRYSYVGDDPANLADPTGQGFGDFLSSVGDFFSGIGECAGLALAIGATSVADVISLAGIFGGLITGGSVSVVAGLAEVGLISLQEGVLVPTYEEHC